MKRIATSLLALGLLFLGSTLSTHAQNVVEPPEQRASPLMMTRAMLGDAYVKITYSSPRKRDRDIFGGLVPMDAVWRTGANEGTELTVTHDIKMGGETLPAGTYTLFSIPGASEWTIIVNSVPNQWGSRGYDESNDVMRVRVPVTMMDDMHEAFTIGLEEIDEQTLHLGIMWDQTMVKVPLTSM